ncbi:MAG: serine--tRNA ligase, partial [Eubacteriales bacterium]|nr:serine--tRNA ligase [Eubacteriales bacterium]
MLDQNAIRSNPEAVAAALAKKGCIVDFKPFLEWDAEKKALLHEIEAKKAQRNKVSSEIPKLKKAGQPVDGIFAEMRALGDEITAGDAKINELNEKIYNFLIVLPNIPDDDLLPGEKENNQVIRVVGEQPKFDFAAKNHVDLCTSLGL